jgi:hypothetical protein
LSAKSSFSGSTSEKKLFGLLPPSSNVTGMMFREAHCMIRHPVVVSPVHATFLTRGLLASGLPASTPKPLTTLMTPARTICCTCGNWLTQLANAALPTANTMVSPARTACSPGAVG